MERIEENMTAELDDRCFSWMSKESVGWLGWGLVK